MSFNTPLSLLAADRSRVELFHLLTMVGTMHLSNPLLMFSLALVWKLNFAIYISLILQFTGITLEWSWSNKNLLIKKFFVGTLMEHQTCLADVKVMWCLIFEMTRPPYLVVSGVWSRRANSSIEFGCSFGEDKQQVVLLVTSVMMLFRNKKWHWHGLMITVKHGSCQWLQWYTSLPLSMATKKSRSIWQTATVLMIRRTQPTHYDTTL